MYMCSGMYTYIHNLFRWRTARTEMPPRASFVVDLEQVADVEKPCLNRRPKRT